MSSRSDESDEHSAYDVKVEIQKTLVSINDTTRKIKTELDAINVLSRKNGQLHTAVIEANKTLTKVAKKMNINVTDTLNDNEENNEVVFHLENALSVSSFQEKILQCINDT